MYVIMYVYQSGQDLEDISKKSFGARKAMSLGPWPGVKGNSIQKP